MSAPLIAQQFVPRPDLAPRTLLVLDCLEREHRANNGWGVSVQRLCVLSGLSSKSSVHAHLVRLVEAGLAERGPGFFDGWRPKHGGGFR